MLRPLHGLVLLSLGSALGAQTASSPQHLVVGQAAFAGGSTQSTNHRLQAVLGEPGGQVLRSPSHRLEAGTTPVLAATLRQQPWLNSCSPALIDPTPGQILELRGIALDLGTLPTVWIGGKQAQVKSRSKDRISVSMPGDVAPGSPKIRIQNNQGQAELGAHLKVRPVFDLESPPGPGVPFKIRYRGKPGDLVVYAIGIGEIPPVKLGSYRHGLAMASILAIPAAMVANQQGELEIPIPAVQYPVGVLLLQGLVDSKAAAYAQGSFTNLLKL